MLGYFAAVAIATGALMAWAHAQPHGAPPGAEGPTVITAIAPGQAVAKFPAADVATFRNITQDMQVKVTAADQAGATVGAKNLETAWDAAQPKLEAMDGATWTAIDGRIDAVLTAVRDANPDAATETQALNDLLTALK
jgi:hypothetical protein